MFREGDRVRIIDSDGTRKAKVIKEYKYFILFSNGKTRETVSKAEIRCGAVKVERK